MGFFRNRRLGTGPMFYTELTDRVQGHDWQPSSLRSPVPMPGHVVLRQREGSISRLDSRMLSHPGDRYAQVDLRRRLIKVHPQTIPTADSLSVTLTLVMVSRTVDPVRFISEAQAPDDEIYLAAQISLREMLTAMPLERFTGARIDLEPVLVAIKDAASTVGVEVSSVLLKDVRLPTEYATALQDALLSKITADTDLEKARNEVKTTRARLASAKVLEQNPVLAKIRILEALPLGSIVEVKGENL